MILKDKLLQLILNEKENIRKDIKMCKQYGDIYEFEQGKLEAYNNIQRIIENEDDT